MKKGTYLFLLVSFELNVSNGHNSTNLLQTLESVIGASMSHSSAVKSRDDTVAVGYYNLESKNKTGNLPLTGSITVGCFFMTEILVLPMP